MAQALPPVKNIPPILKTKKLYGVSQNAITDEKRVVLTPGSIKTSITPPMSKIASLGVALRVVNNRVLKKSNPEIPKEQVINKVIKLPEYKKTTKKDA